MDRFREKKYYIKLDLRGAYNLIHMKDREEWKTAFWTKYRYYKYTIMLFGLTNAPATMQSLINDTLREYLDRFCVIYLACHDSAAGIREGRITDQTQKMRIPH